MTRRAVTKTDRLWSRTDPATISGDHDLPRDHHDPRKGYGPMNKRLASLSAALVFLGAATGTWILPPGVGASSHREAPLISQDPTADNTDVYAFRSPDAPSTITLISNWIPFEEPGGGPNFYHFDDTARYLINVDRDGDAVPDIIYEWTFEMDIRNRGTFLYNTGPITSLDDPDFNYRQFYTVREITDGGTKDLGKKLLQPPDNIGPRSTPDYEDLARRAVYDAGSGIKIFTGQRDEAFYVDVQSIFDLLGLRPFNPVHTIPRGAEPGEDSTGGFNVHTVAIQVPIARLAPTCPVDSAGQPTTPSDQRCVIGVWSTAERRSQIVRGVGTRTGSGNFVQVSRLGNPLVNEVVVELGRKDLFNGSPPTADGAFLGRVTDPELGRLIELLYPGIDVPPAPRDDLVAIFLTGIKGLNQQVKSVDSPSEQLRLNTAVAPSAGVCRGNPLGVLAGDKAGFPNGRRLEDDVTDIELRAVAGVLVSGFNRSQNNALGDGVNENDLPCLGSFPYMATPHQGYDHINHHRPGGNPPGLATADGATRAAGPAEDPDPKKDDDDDDDERKLTEEEKLQRERTNTGGFDDIRTQGDVVGVRCDLGAAIPVQAQGEVPFNRDEVPYALIVTVDGIQQVRLLYDTRTQCGSIQPGDYLEVDGVKQNESLFDAESVTIRRGGRRVR